MDVLLNTTEFDSGYWNFSDTRTPNSDVINKSNQTGYVFDLGPKRDSLYFVIPITVIYVLIFISGVFGNICTCAVVSRNRYMRTTTNYYLFSLALSDLFFLVMGLPQELYLLWNKYPYIFGEAFCMFRGFTSEMSTNTSILTITCFTVERYIAICHPIKAHTMSKLSRAVKLICGVWILGGICAVPLAIQFGVVISEFQGQLVPDSAACTIKSPLKNSFEISTICFFFIPMAIISVLYLLIALELRKSEPSSRSVTQNDTMLNGKNVKFCQAKFLFIKVQKKQSTRSAGGSNISSRKSVIKMLCHDYLHQHFYRIGIAESPDCILCLESPMTAEHLLSCPALRDVRSCRDFLGLDKYHRRSLLYWAARDRMANVAIDFGVG